MDFSSCIFTDPEEFCSWWGRVWQDGKHFSGRRHLPLCKSVWSKKCI